jgi:hypothetical protein
MKSLDHILAKTRKQLKTLKITKHPKRGDPNRPKHVINRRKTQGTPHTQRRRRTNSLEHRSIPKKRIVLRRNQDRNSNMRIMPNQPRGNQGYRRLHISNLNKKVLNSDLKQIFGKIGTLKRCGIHWDSLGNSMGTADLEFLNANDAQRAIDEFNSIDFKNKIFRF